MSIRRRNWTGGFYWVGVAMTAAFIAVVIAGHTVIAARLERTDFPLSWALAAGAVLAFFAAELFHQAAPREPEAPRSSYSPEFPDQSQLDEASPDPDHVGAGHSNLR
jgi:hypothetical protein